MVLPIARFASEASNVLTCQAIDKTFQLALMLAAERQEGRQSHWWPYIQALPATPPNAWLMGEDELQIALQQIGMEACKCAIGNGFSLGDTGR